MPPEEPYYNRPDIETHTPDEDLDQRDIQILLDRFLEDGKWKPTPHELANMSDDNVYDMIRVLQSKIDPLEDAQTPRDIEKIAHPVRTSLKGALSRLTFGKFGSNKEHNKNETALFQLNMIKDQLKWGLERRGWRRKEAEHKKQSETWKAVLEKLSDKVSLLVAFGDGYEAPEKDNWGRITVDQNDNPENIMAFAEEHAKAGQRIAGEIRQNLQNETDGMAKESKQYGFNFLPGFHDFEAHRFESEKRKVGESLVWETPAQVIERAHQLQAGLIEVGGLQPEKFQKFIGTEGTSIAIGRRNDAQFCSEGYIVAVDIQKTIEENTAWINKALEAGDPRSVDALVEQETSEEQLEGQETRYRIALICEQEEVPSYMVAPGDEFKPPHINNSGMWGMAQITIAVGTSEEDVRALVREHKSELLELDFKLDAAREQSYASTAEHGPN